MIRLTLFLICMGTSVAAHRIPYIRAVFDGPEVEHQMGNASIYTPFAIASVGKLFTSVALLRLAEDGMLDLHDLALDWLPDDVVDGLGRMEGITLIHLATMTSGLPDYYGSDFVRAIEEMPLADQSAAFAASFAFNADPSFATGTAFEYSNTNYLLLGMVLEQATNLSYSEVIQEQVLDPLGLKDSFVFGSRPLPDAFLSGHEGIWHVRNYYNGQGYGDGGVISTASDLAKLYSALQGTDLLTEASKTALVTPPLREEYGMGLVINLPYVSHSGSDFGFVSNVVMNMETGKIAVELVGQNDADTSWSDTAID